MEVYEFEGKTIEEAVEKACAELKTERENLEIEVISEGSSGILGIVGVKKAKIRVTLKDQTKRAIKLAKDVLEKFLSYFPMPAKLQIEDEQGVTRFNIIGDGSGILIGKQGQTLNELEHIFQKMVQKQWGGLLPVKIVLDAEGYRKRRIESLKETAQRLAAKAKKLGRTVSTAPLPPAERRVIHITLQQDSGIKTRSSGEGELKRVNIIPVRASQ